MTADLVAFIRARLKDYEGQARVLHNVDCSVHEHLGTPMAALHASVMFTEVPGAVCDCAFPHRVVADIEAKRRILDLCIDLDDRGRPADQYVAERILDDLAAPYADHPDYRQEWRP